jgi:ribonucleotide monophosphatase NagD (HAD superfamily)
MRSIRCSGNSHKRHLVDGVAATQQPTHTRFEYSRILTRLGLPTLPDDISNSSVVMVDFLQHTLPKAKLFVCGEQPLLDDLRAGGGQPDAAAIIAALEACTSTKGEAIVRKPSIHRANAILNLLQLPPDRCIMTGDRLETDV